jgi:hypothetical protein
VGEDAAADIGLSLADIDHDSDVKVERSLVLRQVRFVFLQCNSPSVFSYGFTLEEHASNQQLSHILLTFIMLGLLVDVHVTVQCTLTKLSFVQWALSNRKLYGATWSSYSSKACAYYSYGRPEVASTEDPPNARMVQS